MLKCGNKLHEVRGEAAALVLYIPSVPLTKKENGNALVVATNNAQTIKNAMRKTVFKELRACSFACTSRRYFIWFPRFPRVRANGLNEIHGSLVGLLFGVCNHLHKKNSCFVELHANLCLMCPSFVVLFLVLIHFTGSGQTRGQ